MTPGSCRLLVVLVVGFLLLPIGCSGRKVSSSAGDQATIAGPPGAPPTAPPRAKPPAELPSPAAEPPAPRPDVQKPAPPSVAEQPVPPPPEEVASISPQPELSQPTASASPTGPTIAPPPEAALADVYFDFDRFLIRTDGEEVLEANARMLMKKDGWKLLIEGHCDERGTADYNLVLGERRAQSVKKYLSDLGIPNSKVQIVSYGKEKPFCIEHSDDCWQQNRRAHFVLK